MRESHAPLVALIAVVAVVVVVVVVADCSVDRYDTRDALLSSVSWTLVAAMAREGKLKNFQN
jgi:uncharacterized membrane protein YbhN (UPF0104 family)